MQDDAVKFDLRTVFDVCAGHFCHVLSRRARDLGSCILLLVPSVNTAANRTRGKRLQQASLIDKKPQPKRAQLQKTRTAGLKNLQEKK